MIERFNAIVNMPADDKNGILYAIDGLIKSAKLKRL